MRIFKRALGFLAANVLVAVCMSFLLTEPSMMDILLTQIREDPSIDTIVLGQSHGTTGYDPNTLGELLDCEAINCAKPLMPVRDCYYVLREANRSGQIKRVILDIDYSYWMYTDDLEVGNDTNMFFHTTGDVRMEYFLRDLLNVDYNQTFFDYTVKKETVKRMRGAVLSKLHPAYRAGKEEAVDIINEYTERGLDYEYRGRGFRYGIEPEVDRSFTPDPFQPERVSEVALEYFYRIVDYCREQNIELICCISACPPHRLQHENHDVVHQYFSELCQSQNLKFFDMSFARYSLLPRTNEMYIDYDGHMQGEIAVRQSRLLAEVILSDQPDSYFETDYETLLDSLPQ